MSIPKVDFKGYADWFLGKVKKDQVLILLLALLILSVTLNVKYVHKITDNIRDNRDYRDSIHMVYQKRLDTCSQESKSFLLGIIKKQEIEAAESQKNRLETQKLIFDYQKLYIEYEMLRKQKESK